jgi:hypothetical protein
VARVRARFRVKSRARVEVRGRGREGEVRPLPASLAECGHALLVLAAVLAAEALP